MFLKRFSIIVLTRVAVLCATMFLLVYLLARTSLVATPFIIALLMIVQIFSLTNYLQKTNKEITRFLNSIQYSDFSQSFRSRLKGSSFEELNRAFSEVIGEFKKARTEKEEQYRYLQTVVQHVGVGLMAFTSEGDVELLNVAVKKLLKVNAVKNIRQLVSLSEQLVETLQTIRSGEKALIKLVDNNEMLQLSIYATEFKMQNKHYTLVSISNIQSELEEQQMEAWQNLIRVLTHEIMNSVTPIISLSSTANTLVENLDKRMKESENLPAEELEDVKGALTTITKRSEGLLHFVDDYRNLTRVPAPNFQIIKISALFGHLQQLFTEQLQEKQIAFSTSVTPENLEVTADPDLIEQVLINLILNSLAALSNASAPQIFLKGVVDKSGNVLLHVSDNGHGIPEELYEKIFIPFFTTRKEGSGIGLSLSKQIMRLHKGGIAVRSIPGKETVFTLRF
ncbi:MAG: ATP-binding protein [Bacteroidota bacterium]|nr:ATP-binding protein [Bacteroidota bacterium]